MTREDLEKQDKCKWLLEAPAPIVVGNLIDEIRKYLDFLDELKLASRRPLDEDAIDALINKHNLHNANIDTKGLSESQG